MTMFFIFFLEHMRAVRADGELQLEENFVERWAAAERRAAVLAAQLTELGWPEGERRRDRAVAIRAIEPRAGEPAPRELVIGGGVPAVDVVPIRDSLGAQDE